MKIFLKKIGKFFKKKLKNFGVFCQTELTFWRAPYLGKENKKNEICNFVGGHLI